MTRGTRRLDLPARLTNDERERMGAVLLELRQLQQELLTARSGRLFPSSGHDLDELRAERDSELS
jgi:hypothetical protein